MTREEALTKLKDLKEASDLWDCVEESKALGMAIEALSKIADITQRDLCKDISCEDCPFMQETCKLMDYVAYAEAVQGEWIEVEVFPEVYDIEGVKTWGSEMQCDQCGFRLTAIEGHMAQYNFCPNCGADMRERRET